MLRILSILLLIALAAPLLDGQTAEKFSVQRARAIVGELAAHQFSQVEQQSDDQLRAALPAEKLAEVWGSLEAQVGKFQQIRGVVVSHPAAGVTLVTLVCQFEHTDLDALLPFNSAGQLIGLRLRPSASEASTWTSPEYARPDTFAERAVTVTTGRWQLPGTLTVPRGAGPYPAVVLVQGSGPQDADESIGPNKPFKDLAWGLASRGIAVLRYTKRTKQYGAASVANPETFTVAEETEDDAQSAVALLAGQPEIDPRRVFLLGHSLGASMAPRIAAADTHISGIIMMAGAVTPMEKLAIEQVRTIAARENVPPETVRKQLTSLGAEAKEIESPNLKPGTMVKFLGVDMPSSYWLDLRAYHPDRVAAKLHIPILVLQAGRDYQVPQSEFALWKQALAGHRNVTFDLFPDLNHLFMAGTGPSIPSEYLNPGHIAEPVIVEIAAWIQAGGGKVKQ